MKNTLFLIFMLAAALSVHAEKYALIIAIGDYPEEGKWPDISSQNDVLHVEAALLKLGFPADHIRKITDGQATKQGILDALNGLTSRVTKGDIASLTHTHCHGLNLQRFVGSTWLKTSPPMVRLAIRFVRVRSPQEFLQLE